MNIYKKLPFGLFLAFLFSFSSFAVQSQETSDRIQSLINSIDIILLDVNNDFGDDYQSNWIRVQDMLIDGKYKAARGMLKGMENRFVAQRAKAIRTGDQEAIRIFGANGILAANIGTVLDRYLAS